MFKHLPKRSSNKNTYFYFPILIIFCALFSVFLVYNASSIYAYNYFGNSYYFLINQSIWFGVSLVLFFFIQRINISYIEKYSGLFFFISIFLLILVLLPLPFSVNVYGARRWVLFNPEGVLPAIPFLGRLTLQPSEFFKLALCLFFPKILLSNLHLGEKKVFIKSLFYILGPAILILVEPDLKDFFIVVLIGLAIVFVSNIPLKFFMSGIPVVIIFGLVLVILAPYRFERLKTYLGGGSELGSSYHIKQINIALGSGGLFGVGVGRSIQKNEYLPEVMGDSIFAVFGEEFGYIGSVFLIFILFLVLLTIYKISCEMKNVYYKMVTVGVFTWFAVQSLTNLSSISGIIPLTGVPLPLISYGGSSLVFTVIGLSVIYKFYKEDTKRL